MERMQSKIYSLFARYMDGTDVLTFMIDDQGARVGVSDWEYESLKLFRSDTNDPL